MFELKNFHSIKIGLASPERIREWSKGEVTKAETINYRTSKPEEHGLFCQRIFGPVKNWECACGHYKKGKHKGIVCPQCHVEVTESKVRRERMGHISLAVPVAHIWYYKGTTSRISILLDRSSKDIEGLLNYSRAIVIDPGNIKECAAGDIIDKYVEMQLEETYNDENFKTETGGVAVKKMLQEIDLDKVAEELKEESKIATGQKKLKILKRLNIIESFRKSGARPEWTMIEDLPVLPAGLRPLIDIDGGKRASSDLNELYRKVIIDNNRLKKSIELHAPEVMLNSQKRKIQESVDALIDNERKRKPTVSSTSNRPLKSLTSYLKGKQGRFRQNLLGKRVDYSGRSVIVVGPELKMYQCGLPKEMAKELFKPFICAELDKRFGIQGSVARRKVDKGDSQVYDILAEVIQDHPVLLNRAPTLHRLGIQAFQPILVDGNAIKLHPLVCTAFNADFDGDQMAVHVPLSVEAQAEARFLMLATNNILKLSDGSSVVSPTQDMLLGSYYLTLERESLVKDRPLKAFMSPEEAFMAYQLKHIALQEPIKVRITKEIDGEVLQKTIRATVGKLIFNSYIPQDLGFITRTTKEDMLELEIQEPVKKDLLGQIVLRCYKLKGASKTAEVLDDIKKYGYKYSTLVALTANIYDMKAPKEKAEILKEADAKTLEFERNYNRGRMTDEGRYRQVIAVWQEANNKCRDAVEKNKDKFNDMWMMADSGARGNIGQIAQIVSMKGLVVSTSGIIELPIKSSFKEGLSVLEYFIASHSSRKTLSDTALKTADSGYLTRKLVDVAHDIIVTQEDCNDKKGIIVRKIENDSGVIAKLEDRIKGRYSIDDIKDAQGNIIVPADTMITDESAKEIVNAGIEAVKIRSLLTCKCKNGVCAKCYGRNMASMYKVDIGEAVGVIAAQSIGEPGTQLTMRTFHSGGVASTTDDITQGLPRVQELLDNRHPKVKAVLAIADGVVSYNKQVNPNEIIITENDAAATVRTYDLKGLQAVVLNGQTVQKGDALSIGSKDLDELLQITGSTARVQDYIMQEVLGIYKSAGVPVNPKHIEIIIKQMMKKVRIMVANDSSFLEGDIVDLNAFSEETNSLIQQDKTPAQAKRIIQGITKAALSNESFLSAASFQETPRILTEAAIKSKVDYLRGLKENVILGKLIPAGTGANEYNMLTLQKTEEKNKTDDKSFLESMSSLGD